MLEELLPTIIEEVESSGTGVGCRGHSNVSSRSPFKKGLALAASSAVRREPLPGSIFKDPLNCRERTLTGHFSFRTPYRGHQHYHWASTAALLLHRSNLASLPLPSLFTDMYPSIPPNKCSAY